MCLRCLSLPSFIREIVPIILDCLWRCGFVMCFCGAIYGTVHSSHVQVINERNEAETQLDAMRNHRYERMDKASFAHIIETMSLDHEDTNVVGSRGHHSNEIISIILSQ
eukprot:214724_1